MNQRFIKPVRTVALIFTICFAFRLIEYFLLRTDQSIIGEAFIHKLMGIAVLVVICRYWGYSRGDIGLSRHGSARGILYGFGLGIIVFTIAYGVELIILYAGNQTPELHFFVTSYAIEGNRAMQGSVFYLLVCVLGNIINVFMEEGIFRGLFSRLLESKFSFAKVCFLSSLLFGLWHVTQPIRNWVDGEQSLAGAVVSALILVITSMLMGIQLSMLLKITGSLWAGMGAHFANNTVVNLLHVWSGSEYDILQTMRISIAQTLSFFIVLTIFLVRKSNRQPTFR